MTRIVFAAMAALVAYAQPPMDGRLHVPSAKAAQKLSRAALPSAAFDAPPYRRIELRAVETPAEPAVNAHGQSPVGTAMPVSEDLTVGWELLPGGRAIWRAQFQSAGAVGLRLHFREFSVGRGRVWTYSPGNREVDGEYSGSGPYNDGDFWSGTVAADAMIVEYEPAPGANPGDAPPFQIDAVGQFWSGVTPAASSAPQVAACHLDFKCYSQWQQAGSGVAHMLYQSADDQKFYVCTGALLETRSKSSIPYFLTANHCIGADNEARSLETYWFYETAQCNGATVTRSVATRVDGARLLYTAGMAEGDYSMLRLNGVPNSTVWFAGWDPADQPLNTNLTGIHHPSGSFKRISFGQRIADRTVTVGGTPAPADKFYRVYENQGRIEGGSSGSPLYIDNGRVAGVLSHGPVPPPGQTACEIADFVAGYGRFSVMYPALRQFLEDGAPAGAVTATPGTLTFRMVNGVVQAPAQQTMRIDTASASTIAFTLSSSAAWLRPSITSGSVVAGTPVTVTVTIDPASIRTSGSQSGAITVNAGAAAPITVAVNLTVAVNQSVVGATLDPSPVYEENPDSDGFRWFYSVRVTETAGVETRLTSFKIDGTDRSADIVSFFGTDRIPAFGTISAGLRARGLTVPTDRVFEFAGADTASGQAWTLRTTGRFLGRRTAATVKLAVSPDPVSQDPTADDCGWRHDVVVTETAGIGVNLNRWIAGGFDLSSDIASWFGSARLPGSGTVRAALCWRNVRVPTSLEFEVGGTDDAGNDVRVTVQARFVGAPAQTLRFRVAPERLAFSAATGRAETLVALVNVDPDLTGWSARIVYDGTTRDWLTAFPLSGFGPGNIAMVASGAGRAAGRYTATMTIEASGLSPVSVPIVLTVAAQAGARPDFTQAAVVNAASFLRTLAPGMLFTIIGQNLAANEEIAQRIPLPYLMANAVVRANGIVCPLYYVSPRQINAQLPYEIQPGQIRITVNVEGRESSVPVDVSAVGPGVFTLDGTRPTPQPSGRRGDILIAYVTGSGVVSPQVATGDAPSFGASLNSLPRSVAPVEVTVGGVRAEVFFAGIPPGIVGVIQVNYRIPANAPLGSQPLLFTVGGVRANSVTLQVQ